MILVKDSKIETIAKFYVERVSFEYFNRIHNLYDKISTLNLLISA